PQAAALESALALRPASARDRFAVGAATLSLLAAHAEEAPVAALIDDAHWLDGSSADALLFAMRRLVADPIAVVVAVRDAEPSFVDGAQLPTLHLSGLDRDAAAALVGDAAADRLYAPTAANPLAPLELAPADERRAAHRALAGALPDRDADRRAWHLALATVGPDDAASSALEQAGARAYERSAYAVAAAAYERAAALSLEPAPLLYSAAD